MSYLVLARKSRPKTFREVVGQKAIVRTLQNALVQNRVSHALIFSGVRGVGKTTLARIMAKAINCSMREQDPEPCNECTSCVEINAGNSVDLVEIDGASNRGIQEIRELKENIRFMPTGSRYKIIIIDEVHMLTTEAFNALLKTLEEPPEHVYFMFATTELHRVPITILSRCQRYELKRIDSRELKEYFETIADQESVRIEPAALNLIVREAGGSVRDGLSLLDQVFSYCGHEVKAEDVVEVLGLSGHQVVAELSGALLAGDLAKALEVLDQTYTFGIDVKRFINDLLAWFRSLVVCSFSKDPGKILDFPDEEFEELVQSARKYPPQTFILMFNVLMENLEKAGYSSQPRYALEMALIKAVQVSEVVPTSRILGKLDQLFGDDLSAILSDSTVIGNREKKTIDGESCPKTSIIPSGYQEQTYVSELKKLQASEVEGNTDDNYAIDESDSAEKKSTGNRTEQHDSAGRVREKVSATVGADNKVIRQHWNDFVEYVKDRKPWMASALQMAKTARLVDGELIIEYENSVNCKMLGYRENITLLTEFALDFFQEDFRVRFSVPDSTACDVDPANGNKVKQERQALANDALVLTAVDIFNGEVGDIRVGPRFRSPVVENNKNLDNPSADEC